ncbi:response regulator transcription factor [Falsiroseomonas tokyonensis]|uniref:Response regulator transcription factor n=1 Tax=Falsiroseomonas tokyonensis TaxID=430521 RepID=A0ABV7C5I1_9PROT|nr:response regulator [Falsiroseomonas tokyonensis]MBU8541436.1 response regulator [Falsiroseomonas tokyonensis]
MVDRTACPLIVHLIDDDADVRWGIETLLSSAGFKTQSWPDAASFLNALPEINQAQIGCVLTDVRMPEMDGLDLLRRLTQLRFARPVLLATGQSDIALAVRAMKAGAFDFIEKPFEENALLTAIAEAFALAGTVRPPPRHDIVDAARRIALLSPREREVLDLAMTGMPSKVIAHELNISPRTVEVHRLRLMARLGVGSLAEAVRLSVLAELGDGGAASRISPPDQEREG